MILEDLLGLVVCMQICMYERCVCIYVCVCIGPTRSTSGGSASCVTPCVLTYRAGAGAHIQSDALILDKPFWDHFGVNLYCGMIMSINISARLKPQQYWPNYQRESSCPYTSINAHECRENSAVQRTVWANGPSPWQRDNRNVVKPLPYQYKYHNHNRSAASTRRCMGTLTAGVNASIVLGINS